MNLSNLSEEQLSDYVSGKLRLVTSKTGGTRLAVATKRKSNDLGITSLERRAYGRMWYLKNRDKCRARTKAWRLRRQTEAPAPPQPQPQLQPEPQSRAQKQSYESRQAYFKEYRIKNRDARAAKQREYRAKQREHRAKLKAYGLRAKPNPKLNHTEYMRQYRQKNKAKLAAYARKKYHAKRNALHPDQLILGIAKPQPKPGLLARALGWLARA